MKFLTIFSLIAMMILGSCAYDRRNIPNLTNNNIIPPPVCTDTVHFAATIQPILVASCELTGCHVARNQGGGPNALDYTVFANVQLEDSAIYSRLTMLPSQTGIPGFMPKNASPLTAAQIQSFYCWWKQGGLFN